MRPDKMQFFVAVMNFHIPQVYRQSLTADQALFVILTTNDKSVEAQPYCLEALGEPENE